MRAADGKMRLTDVADTEQLFRIINDFSRSDKKKKVEEAHAGLSPQFFIFNSSLLIVKSQESRVKSQEAITR